MLAPFIFRCNLIFFQIFGLFPYYYDAVCKRWRSSRFIKIYSFLVFVLQLLAILIGIAVVSSDIEKSNPSQTMLFSSIIACALLVTNLVVAYTQQLKNLSLFIEFANDMQFIYSVVRSSCRQSDHRSLIKISVKLTAMNIINCMVTIIEIKRMSSLSSAVRNNILYQMFYFCPNVALLMIPTMFYCVEMLLEHTVKQFNCVLAQIAADSSRLNNNKQLEQRKMYTMRQSCDLSDRIESITIIYSRLYRSTVTLNKAFGVQLLASNCSSVVSLIQKLYLEFYSVMMAPTSSSYLSVVFNSLYGLFNQFLYIYVTYLVAGTSSNITEEVSVQCTSKWFSSL